MWNRRHNGAVEVYFVAAYRRTIRVQFISPHSSCREGECSACVELNWRASGICIIERPLKCGIEF